ncbi:hypothetical protein EV195_101134 [Tenacibaculum skagerrakense]|uniref:Lipocalin-like domain-containing protein n=1 Tax=Tenacibaculum skagerrakense TaxID=186571 RepID=A0A4R2P2Q4_9FLAO|nr:hypothetical protein [Tenacibaculum skagerrakense]TCP27975.1 hypothetical protein EV195_101134 [Tenacibaculum skagerrakense]
MKTVFYLIIMIPFLSCTSIDKSIEGKWMIKNIEITSFSLPEGCEKISVGDKLNFDNGNMEILTDGYKCSTFKYILRDQNLELLISDMSISMKVISLNSNELKIRSKSLPKEMMINWKEEYLKYIQEGFLITLKRR